MRGVLEHNGRESAVRGDSHVRRRFHDIVPRSGRTAARRYPFGKPSLEDPSVPARLAPRVPVFRGPKKSVKKTLAAMSEDELPYGPQPTTYERGEMPHGGQSPGQDGGRLYQARVGAKRSMRFWADPRRIVRLRQEAAELVAGSALNSGGQCFMTTRCPFSDPQDPVSRVSTIRGGQGPAEAYPRMCACSIRTKAIPGPLHATLRRRVGGGKRGDVQKPVLRRKAPRTTSAPSRRAR
ncbi:DUF6424 family protein [Streptomyces sp. NPDC085927]|uniref:DUF6424 family protein n=1 Tax=Streptomyces sp. NPDC085927 TaxID=3365738 RepID=UPI0037CFD56C